MEEGWKQALDRHPPDAILVRRAAPVAPWLPHVPGLALVYQDDTYALVARSDLHLPFVDRTAERIQASFP
jgi:hypothetical protein